jgi:hypothetical protein
MEAMDMAGGIMLEAVRVGIMSRPAQPTELAGELSPTKSTFSPRYWFSGTYKITVRIYDVPDDVLQIIEDDLSDRLKPAFGNQGGNNK